MIYSYGRQFDLSRKLSSRLTRPSINALKEFYKDFLTPDKIKLILKLKKILSLD